MIYRVKIQPLTGFLTQWQADSVFAALCWQIAYYDGEDELAKFLEPFKNSKPTFLLSNGFPNDYLPAPLSLHTLYPEINEHCSSAYDLAKSLKKVKWLKLNEFNALLNSERPFPPDGVEKVRKRNPFKTVSVPHASINRLTGTTGEEGEGGYYELQENFIINETQNRKSGYISIYIRLLDESIKSRVEDSFKRLAESGFGKRKSIGKGHFEVASFEQFDGFVLPEKPDAFVTLSNFCPAEDDPTEGFYRTFVKYGKLGEQFAVSDNPFKRPLIMFTAGSVFEAKEWKNYYGRLLTGVSTVDEVVHYAFAFPMPIKMLKH